MYRTRRWARGALGHFDPVLRRAAYRPLAVPERHAPDTPPRGRPLPRRHRRAAPSRRVRRAALAAGERIQYRANAF